ncbi:MAG: NAD-dependent epimerase/dehydratase family protein [Litorimonas sp.]
MVGRRALVTGATGGLGQTLVLTLIAQGYTVDAMGRNSNIGHELSEVGANFIAYDLSTPFNPDIMKHVDVVFHLAALSSPWGKAESFESINVTATQSLCRAAKQMGVECFIFTSSPSIYAMSMDRINIKDGDAPASPFANHYARTKFDAEKIVLNTQGLHRIIIRPRAIVGPNDTVLLPRLMAALKRRVLPLPNEGRALIELTDVRDVVSALISADEHRVIADGQAFNISGGDPLELRRILSTLSDKFHLNLRTIHIPTKLLAGLSALLAFGANLWPGQPEPPLTPYMVKTLAFSQTFDLSKAKEVLKWAPLYSSEDAINAALEGIKI